MQRPRLKFAAVVLVAAGVGLLLSGGSDAVARILLFVGLVYAVMVAVAEWRERRQ